MSAIQLSQARTSLQNVLKDISDVGSSVFVEWCQFLSDSVYRDLIATDQERFIQEVNINATAGTTNYSLATVASDFKTLQPFGCGLFLQDSSGNNSNLPLAQTGFGASEVGYYINGGNIVLTPTPQKAQTLVLRYIPEPPVYTSTSDYFTLDKTSSGVQILPGEYMRYVQRALTVLYMIWDEDLGMEAYADARFVRVLNELLRDIRREPNVYVLPDYTVAF